MNTSYPHSRLRRTRLQAWTRELVAQSNLKVSDLILPLFVKDGASAKEPIASMPGVYRYSIDTLLAHLKSIEHLKIPLIALFPVTPLALKTEDGSEAFNPDNLICRAVRAIKDSGLRIGVMCDVALDPYTTHGHDGIMENNEIVNDASVEALIKQALVQAAAGCDVIAPSDMMDGRIGAIRRALESTGFHDTLIMSYAAKYASCFYGPFRDALGSKAQLKTKDKKSYQMDPRNSDEALREAALDVQEGADMLLIKPGMPYLDILYRVKEAFKMPTFAYQVSGEYSMIHAAAAQGYVDLNAAFLESLICFKRAGADGILTYAAVNIASQLSSSL
jgi:porphobilinogen synthase